MDEHGRDLLLDPHHPESPLTSQKVRRGVYHDVSELIAAIKPFIEGHNQRTGLASDPTLIQRVGLTAQPFLWSKTAEQILAKATKNNPPQERCTRAGKRSKV